MIYVAYTSTDEIVHTVQESYNEKKDDIRHHEIDKELPIKLADLENHMYMAVAPDPDILVRTSDETRLSNFLLCWPRRMGKAVRAVTGYSLVHVGDKGLDCMVWAGMEYDYIQLYNYGWALVKSVELRRTKWVHYSAIRGGSTPEVEIGTALLDTSSKCGAIDASGKVFDQMLQESIVSRSAMIVASAMHVNVQNALVLLTEMKLQVLMPNAVTILSVIQITIDVIPGASIWGALLSACSNYGDSELGGAVVSLVVLSRRKMLRLETVLRSFGKNKSTYSEKSG
ncbi:hypothetical protein GIB67_023958 [Kingdonia uniflora]|uniref:Uncharacterized protein n=1 Tax=Kingdonia uniflora TaxID=39325 RepID=A0A7J7LPN8_9MAGN|nr:hypothetical protein GIB67_023958 [Kingdonia uniflora]